MRHRLLNHTLLKIRSTDITTMINVKQHCPPVLHVVYYNLIFNINEVIFTTLLALRPILQANAIGRKQRLDFEPLRVLLDCPLFSPLLSLPSTMIHGDDIELRLTRPRRSRRLSERRIIVPFNASSAYFYSSICSQTNTSI